MPPRDAAEAAPTPAVPTTHDVPGKMHVLPKPEQPRPRPAPTGPARSTPAEALDYPTIVDRMTEALTQADVVNPYGWTPREAAERVVAQLGHSTPAGALREALEHVLDMWPAPSPEEFARLHRVLTGHDSCSSRPSDERVPESEPSE